MPEVQIIDFGILEYDQVRMAADETSSIGAKLGQARGLRVAAQTDRIPIRPGLAYGISFVVKGAVTEDIKIKAVQRSSNPCVLKTSGQVVFHNDSLLSVRIGQVRHIGARFPASQDENHCQREPQPGTYTFELYAGDRRLASKTFHLYF